MADHSARVLERLFVDRLARINLAPESLRLWDETKSGHRFMAYPTKELVVYTLASSGVPKIVDVLHCVSVKCDGTKGFSSTWSRRDGSTMDIGYSPVEVAPGCFLFQPHIINLEYSQYRQGMFNSRFSICYRTLHHPDYVDLGAKLGIHFLIEENIYSDRFGSV